jgi:hypothetical protein
VSRPYFLTPSYNYFPIHENTLNPSFYKVLQQPNPHCETPYRKVRNPQTHVAHLTFAHLTPTCPYVLIASIITSAKGPKTSTGSHAAHSGLIWIPPI